MGYRVVKLPTMADGLDAIEQRTRRRSMSNRAISPYDMLSTQEREMLISERIALECMIRHGKPIRPSTMKEEYGISLGPLRRLVKKGLAAHGKKGYVPVGGFQIKEIETK